MLFVVFVVDWVWFFVFEYFVDYFVLVGDDYEEYVC